MRLRSNHAAARHGGLTMAAPPLAEADRPYARDDLPVEDAYRSLDDPAATPLADSTDPDAGLHALHAAILGHGRTAGSAVRVIVTASIAPAPPVADMVGDLAALSARLGYQVLLVDFAEDISGDVAGVEANHDPTGHPWRVDAPAPVAFRQSVTPGLALLTADARQTLLQRTIQEGAVAAKLRAAAARCDLILIDAGAVTAEALASLASGTDGALLFVGRHRTAIRDVRAALHSLAQRDIAIIGTVIV